MNLQVHILEARNLAPGDSNGLSDPYAYVQLGSSKARTSTVYSSLNPVWTQVFNFTVGDIAEDLVITVWDKDQILDDFLGQIKIPIWKVFDAEDHVLPPEWYSLEKRRSKSKIPVTGEILVSLCLCKKSELPGPSLHNMESKHQESEFFDSAEGFPNLSDKTENPAVPLDPPGRADCTQISNVEPTDPEDAAVAVDILFDASSLNYGEPTSDKLPDNLPGGILLDKQYSVNMKELNSILFGPGSQLYKDLYLMQKTTDVEEFPWKKSEGSLWSRVVKYTKAATMMVKAIEVTEEQSYFRADRACYAVDVTVRTPDVPYGKCFCTELHYIMVPVPDVEVGTSLTISFQVRFVESTMMKSVIESKAKQGLEENFKQLGELLSRYAEPLDMDDDKLDDFAVDITKSKFLWKSSFAYFANTSVLCAVLLLFLVLVHIALSSGSAIQGLEIWIIDLPDSIQEIILTSVFVIFMQRLWNRTRHFYARIRQKGDHGVRAVGEGWMLSVVLVECECLASIVRACAPDPFVVFKCRGQKRTSSVRLQTSKPHWQEYFEFDAMRDPPSRMELEVFHFGGPSCEPISLGHGEVSLLKESPVELADMWIPLDGHLAKMSKSRAHIKVSLKLTQKEYIETQYFPKIEKRAGKKVLKLSPERNLSFQKLFSLPQYEFLVDDFACALKYKVPIQGRLFLSPRILGFYSALFGRKTKLAFVWEDVQDVKHDAPMNRMGDFFGSSLSICVKKGRADKLQEYAKKVDVDGQLYFQFHSFVKFKDACRMVMSLWQAKSLSPMQRMDKLLKMSSDMEGSTVQEKQESDVGTFLGLEDAKLMEQCTIYFPLKIESICLLYEDQEVDSYVMEKVGALNYVVTNWNSIAHKTAIQQRQVTFRLNLQSFKRMSEVTCIQQKMVEEDKRSCKIDEQLTFYGLPVGDSFQLQVRKEFQEVLGDRISCSCRLYIGVAWRKSCSEQEIITTNITDEFTKLNKKYLELAKKEIIKADAKSI